MYEYKILEFLGQVKGQEILNEHAKEGWRVHTYQVYSYVDAKSIVILERQTSDVLREDVFELRQSVKRIEQQLGIPQPPPPLETSPDPNFPGGPPGNPPPDGPTGPPPG